jgi:hypothetical protein
MPGTDKSDIVRRRLAVQRLVGPGLARASDVVREQVAVQSQDYAGAKWALAQRTTGRTDAEVEDEFTQGAMLRTHVLRPTWHFVAPEDLRWLLALTGPRVNRLMAQYDRRLGLTAAVYRKSQAVIEKSLTGKYLMRSELADALKRGKISIPTGQTLAHIMMRAELDGLVTSGPRRGKQFTYALLEERVKPAPKKDRDEALGDLTRRYFATRGPATAQDCGWWSGLTQADLKRGIEIAGRALHREEINGREYWSVKHASPKPVPSVHLLPNYDEYFIGYKDRSAIGQRIGSVKSVTGGNALIAYVVAVDGQLVGGWKRVIGKKSVEVKVDLVVPLTAAEKKRVEAEIDRFKRFIANG